MTNKSTWKVEFTRTGKSLEVPEDAVLLEYALRHGVDLDYGCQGGSCGACMVRVDGQVSQWGRCIDEEEKADGFVLLCSAFACSDLRIEA